jgi:SNF2 family DNA or RNA helicase
MIALGTVTVHAAIMPSGSLFVWGVKDGGGVIDPLDLRAGLFGWHAPSFYGTFIEAIEYQMKEGIVLPAAEALGYFASSEPLMHARLQWSSELGELVRQAKSVQEAIAAQQFMPDFDQWKTGRNGWKLELPEGQPGPLLRGFADALAREALRGSGELEARLSRLAQGFPTAGPNAWLDEDDWLVAIGWRSDACPFRTGLQLVEPEAPGLPWRLQVLLQGRELPDLLVPCSLAGEPLPATEPGATALPQAWREAIARARKDVQRWLHIVPWLRDSERVRGFEGSNPAVATAGSAPAAALVSAFAPAAVTGSAPASAQADATAHASALALVATTAPALRGELSDDEAWRFLAEASLQLLQAGCVLFLPAWWDRVRRTKPRLKARVASSVGTTQQSLVGLNQMVQFDWKVAIGDLELTEDEYRQLLEQKRNLVRFRNQWVQLDPVEIERIRQTMKQVNRRKGLSLRDVLEVQLLQESASSFEPDNGDFIRDLRMEVELNDHLRRWIDTLKQQTGIPPLEPPIGFHGSLRHYQKDGFAWLVHLRQYGLGCCLADDMGLGKTIQFISYLLHIKEQDPATQPALLICPTSVLGNWQKELQRFAPTLRVHMHYGPQRLRGAAFTKAIQRADVLLISYTLAHLDESLLTDIEWGCICLDEAQNIKNAYTKQAASIRKLDAFHRIALTGTPIENRLTELWSIFDFLNPAYLGTLREFTTRFVTPIEKYNDTEATSQVQRLVKPFLLRRLKKDPAIQLDLPNKTESKTYVSLTAEQASLYESAIQGLFEKIDTLTSMERRGHILASLTRLKQVCNHPALFLKEPIGTNIRWQDRSGKIERLLDMVRELRAEGDRCLIFTQFVETGHLLQEVFRRELGESTRFLHGGTPRRQRDEWIQAFQSVSESESKSRTESVSESGLEFGSESELGSKLESGSESGSGSKLILDAGSGLGHDRDGFSIFILSLKAGGVGLNLTAANHVFHFDRWWNPAVENQATDRAFRIGQTRHVQVHKFVTLGTLEERIDEMLERKQNLSRQVVGSGENWITELTTDELKELFLLRQEWIT